MPDSDTINYGFAWSFVAGTQCKTYIPVGFGHLLTIFLDIRKPVDEDCIAYLSRETLRGIDYMHRQGKIHRDIKVSDAAPVYLIW